MSPTVPGSPSGLAVEAGNGQAIISWTAPADGGNPITSYTASDGQGHTCTATTITSCIVTGLTNGQTYTFAVIATNAQGASAPSGPVSVNPAATFLFVNENTNGPNEVRNHQINSDGTTTLVGSYSTGHLG